MKISDILKEIIIVVVLAISQYVVADPSQTVLHPDSFDSEISTVDHLVEEYNTYKTQEFIYQLMMEDANGYRVVYQRQDGVQASFLFRKNQQLKEFRISVYNDEGSKLCEKGVDVGSMLAYHVFQYSLNPKNHYDMMKLFSSWEPDMSVTMDDEYLGAIRIVQDKETHTISMKLTANRNELKMI